MFARAYLSVSHLSVKFGGCSDGVMLCDSDTLTDVSSLHDLDNDVDDDDDDVDDDTISCSTQVVTDAERRTSSDSADGLSDLTIPDFTVRHPRKIILVSASLV